MLGVVPRINVESGRQTLASAPARKGLVIVRLRTKPGFTRRLGTLGVRPGAHVEILHRSSGGGRVLAVAGSRLALDSTILNAIDAEEVGE